MKNTLVCGDMDIGVISCISGTLVIMRVAMLPVFNSDKNTRTYECP
jgi:hypothetical protein